MLIEIMKVYDEHYNRISMQYNCLSLLVIIMSALLTTLEAAKFADFESYPSLNYSMKGISVFVSFVITCLTAVIRFLQYREKLESIGKFLDILESKIHEIDIVTERLYSTNISDGRFFEQLQKILM